MAQTGAGFRIESATHGEVTLGRALEAWLREEAEWVPLEAGPFAGVPGLAVTPRGYEAVVVVTDLAAEPALGTKATLELTLKAATGERVILTLPNMKRGPCEWNLRRAPHARALAFRYEGALLPAPLAVSV